MAWFQMVLSSYLQLLRLIILIWKPVHLLALQCHLVEYSKTINLDYISLTSPTQKYTPTVIQFVHWQFEDPLHLASTEQKFTL